MSRHSSHAQGSGHTQYILPTTPLTVSVTPTFNDSSGSPWSHPVEIDPSLDLSWMGHLLVPEARAAARWAYINTTYLATNLQEVDTLASVCSLYPCMRTYTSSVANNLLTETLVDGLSCI